jgi:hypothetical protein
MSEYTGNGLRFQSSNDQVTWVDAPECAGYNCVHRFHRYFLPTQKKAAAPPQHPARAAGQRWRSSGTLGKKAYIVEGTLTRLADYGGNLGLGWVLSGATVGGAPQEDMVFYESCWSEDGRMTLLAPQGAAVGTVPTPCKSPCEPMCNAGSCADCDREFAGSDYHAPLVSADAKAPTPVCLVRYSASGCCGEVLMRVLTKAGAPRLCCETCMIAQDDQFARAVTVRAEGLGKPYAGPERLPRPRLAHSMQVEDDTLEDC